MGIEIPDSLQWVAKYILGAGDWPEGDETAMRRLADAWTSTANALDTVDDQAAAALNAALSALSEGETHDAIAAYRDKLLAGDDAAFTAIRKWCEKQAELLDDGANDIEHTKLVIIGTMIVAAVQIGAAIATAWTGVGAAAGVAARVAAQVSVRIAIRQLISRMIARGAAKAAARAALRGAMFEALEEGGIDALARTIQVAKGDRSMDDFGWTDLGLATFGGAVGGAVGGAMGDRLGGVGDQISSKAGKLAANSVAGAATELGADLSAQVATAGVASALLDQEFKLDIGVDTFTSAGAGGIQSGLESGSRGGTTTAPDVPDLGNVPGGTPSSQPNGESPSTTPASTGPQSPSTPSTAPGEGATQPASTQPSTSAPSAPSNDSPGPTAPGNTSPASATPGETSPASTTPSDTSPASTTPNDTSPAQNSPSPSGPTNDSPTPNSPVSDSPSPSSPANHSPTSNSPADQSPSSSSPADSPPAPTAPTNTATPESNSPSSPTNSGPAPTGTPSETSPSTPGDSTPTPSTPGDTNPSTPGGNSPSTPSSTAPSTPDGDTSPSAPNSSPPNPSTPANTSPSDPGDTTPSTPSSSTPNSSTPADTASSTPDGGTNPSTPSDTAPSPSTPANTTPSAPGDTTPSTPNSAPTSTNPTGPTNSPSSLELPPVDTPTQTQPTTPTDSTPAPSTTQPSTPSESAQTTPGTTPANPGTSPTTPGTTAPPSSPNTPTTPTNTQPDPNRTPQSDGTTTAAATMTPTAPTAGTPTPTPTSTPASPAGAVPPMTATPVTPATHQPATSSPQPSTPTRPAAPTTPASQPTSSSAPPSTPARATPSTPAGPPPATPQSPPSQQPPGTSPNTSTPPVNPSPFGPSPTNTVSPTANSIPPQHNQSRALRESLRGLPSQDGRTPAIDTNRNPYSQRPPAYRVRRFHLGGNQWVAVGSVRAHIPDAHLMSPAELHQAMENIQATVDAAFNNGSRLLSGDQFLMDVEFTTDPAAADLDLAANRLPNDTANALRDQFGLFPAAAGQPLGPRDLREISNDIARANTPARFSDPADSRVVDHRRLGDLEHPSHQARVEDALRRDNRFTVGADPRTHPYGQLVNDGGRTVPGRSNNCLDCSLSALSSFFGVPRVSAPRFDDRLSNGARDNQSGEVGGPARAQEWLGANFQSYTGMPVSDQYQALHDYVAALGPGSAALVGTDWHARDANGNKLFHPDGTPVLQGGHATVVVFPPGAPGPVWWDPQSGETSLTPPSSLTENAAIMQCIPIDANGGPAHAGTGTNPGTGQSPAGPDTRTEPGVQHPGERARLGVPTDPVTPGTAPAGDGPGGLRDQQGDGRDHRALERGAPGDRGGVRPDDSGRATTSGLPDPSPDPTRARLSENAPNPADSDIRGPEQDQVSGRADLPGTPDRSGDLPADRDHQESSHRDPVGSSLDDSDGLGTPAEPSDRELAADRGDRGLTDSQQDTATAPAHTTLTPQDLESATRARQARESLRSVTPANDQALQVKPTTGRPYRSASYPTALGQPVRVIRVTAAVTASPTTPPTTIDAVADRTQLATDLTFNQGNQFPLGDWLMVDVVPTTNPATADLTIDADTNPTRTDLANTLRATLGLPPTTNPTLTPADIHQLGSDISRADLARATTPSWADQHTTPSVDTNPTVDLDAIHNQHAEQTPAGVSHHRGDPTMGDLPHRVPADPHRFTADTHITPDGNARIGDHTLTPEQYGDLLRRSGWDGTTPIRLIGCDASTNDFANRLSQHLGVEVLAPTQAAWTDANGNVFTSSAITNPDGTRIPRIPPDGQWHTHHPSGATTNEGPNTNPAGTRSPSEGGFAPETAVDRARPVAPRTDPPNRNPSPQMSAEWDPPSNSGGTPLSEVEMTVEPTTRILDSNGELPPNSRIVATDSAGNPRGTFYTDADGRVTHADLVSANTGHGRTVNPLGDNPDISSPETGVVYRVQSATGIYPHTYVGTSLEDSRPSGAQPAASLSAHTAAQTGTTDPQQSLPQRFDEFRGGPIDPAVDWDPRGNDQGMYSSTDPITDYDTATQGPFSLQQPREPHTRYDVYNTDGNWHGSFYTDEYGAFSHIHTWSGNQTHGFNPELGTGATWDANLSVPCPNTTYAVGPRHLEHRGLDPREPRQLFRTDDNGDTVAASVLPTYSPAGITAETFFGPRRGLGGSTDLQTDVGNIAGGGRDRHGNYLPGEYDSSLYPDDPSNLFRFAGGHLAPYEAGGPGERINHVPQWAYENSSWRLEERPTSDSWRRMESDQSSVGRSPDAEIRRIDVFAERHTPNIRTPDRLHVRFTVSPVDSEEYIQVRNFHNVPAAARNPAPGSRLQS
ncbi:toxin glutamine deamidase domain-containing protein [Nocardia sp. NPDC058176]|uniref:toxin glutamine deamidase domain-containing protein n=1 Tax=Nocardia sp. NPDC058176 TaxID=3346368 RepID=UPI0036DC154E